MAIALASLREARKIAVKQNDQKVLSRSPLSLSSKKFRQVVKHIYVIVQNRLPAELEVFFPNFLIIV